MISNRDSEDLSSFVNRQFWNQFCCIIPLSMSWLHHWAPVSGAAGLCSIFSVWCSAVVCTLSDHLEIVTTTTTTRGTASRGKLYTLIYLKTPLAYMKYQLEHPKPWWRHHALAISSSRGGFRPDSDIALFCTPLYSRVWIQNDRSRV